MMPASVLLLTETAKPTSGWGRIAHEMIQRYQARGISVTILTEDGSGDGGPILKGALASLKKALLAGWRARRYAATVDIVHALDVYPYGLIGAIATIGTKKPLVMTAIGTYAIMPLESKRLRPFVTWALRRAKIIMPIVNYTAQEMKKRVSGLPRIERVRLGVDAQRFPFAPLEAEEPFFLSVGALKKRRGNHFMLPALALIKKDFPNIRYAIVGDDSDAAYVSFLKSEIVRLSLQENVRILGKIAEAELKKLYQTCTAFVGIPDNTATNFAGFHLVYLEANAMGKPVIAAQGYGTEEYTIDGENGFTVEPKNPASIAAALVRILQDKALRSHLATRSRAIAEELSWDATVREYLTWYSTVLS